MASILEFTRDELAIGLEFASQFDFPLTLNSNQVPVSGRLVSIGLYHDPRTINSGSIRSEGDELVFNNNIIHTNDPDTLIIPASMYRDLVLRRDDSIMIEEGQFALYNTTVGIRLLTNAQEAADVILSSGYNSIIRIMYHFAPTVIDTGLLVDYVTSIDSVFMMIDRKDIVEYHFSSGQAAISTITVYYPTIVCAALGRRLLDTRQMTYSLNWTDDLNLYPPISPGWVDYTPEFLLRTLSDFVTYVLSSQHSITNDIDIDIVTRRSNIKRVVHYRGGQFTRRPQVEKYMAMFAMANRQPSNVVMANMRYVVRLCDFNFPLLDTVFAVGGIISMSDAPTRPHNDVPSFTRELTNVDDVRRFVGDGKDFAKVYLTFPLLVAFLSG